MLKLFLLILTIQSTVTYSNATETIAANQYEFISDASNTNPNNSANENIVISRIDDLSATRQDQNKVTANGNTEVKYSADDSFVSKHFIPFLRDLIGLFLILAGIVFLWFNEKKAVEMSRILNFGEKACEEIQPDQYDSELNGELVHITGKVSTTNTLHDESFGVQVKDCVKLKRVVQVYQFKEVKRSGSNSAKQENKNVDYEKTWCEYSIPSVAFLEDSMRQSNDKAKFISYKMVFTANNVDLGSYKLTPYQIERLDNWIPLQLRGEAGITFSRDIKERLNNLSWGKQVIEVNDNCIMIKQGENEDPQIGDIKVSFYQLSCDTVTVISEQAGITFRPYNIKERKFIRKSEAEKERLLDEEEQRFDQALENSIDRCCWGVFCCWMDHTTRNPMRSRETIDWIYPGRISKKDFFTSQIKIESWQITNTLRVICTILFSIGLYMTFSAAISKLVVVKLLNEIVSSAYLISNIGLGILGTVLVAGFAWIFYRRWFGLGIVLGAASVVGIIYVCQELKLA